MNYNDKHPTISFRIGRNEKSLLDKDAEKKNTVPTEIAKDIIIKYYKGELVNKRDDHQLELIRLKIEKLKLENKYLTIKCDFAENFGSPLSHSASIHLKPKPMIINDTKSEEFQSPYDASNHRLQCVDCGKLFNWYSYDEFNSQMQKFQRHLSEDHKRKMNETEKEVITYLSYEGDSVRA